MRKSPDLLILVVFPRILLFFCFYRIAAGLLTLLISGFSLASSCKSENKYRNNEDMKVHFYQVSCYFTVILNVSVSRCNSLCTSRTFSYQSHSFQKETDCCWVFSLAVFRRTMLMVIHIFKSHNVVFPKALHAHFDALPQEFDALLLPSVCVSNSHWPLQDCPCTLRTSLLVQGIISSFWVAVE